MSEVRKMRCKLAVSLALAYRDYEVYQNVLVGGTEIDIKAEKFLNGRYDTFYVIVKTVEFIPKNYNEINMKLTQYSDTLNRPVYLAIVRDDGKEMILDSKLRSRMLLPENTKVREFRYPDNDYTI